jgi:aspartyl-tRNA(Asn)/glutamyl-tRNA(Gln) amidotransferase subunit B
VLAEVVRTGKSPSAVVDEQGLAQVSDTSELEAAVRAAIESGGPAAVADYRSGKDTAINFLSRAR